MAGRSAYAAGLSYYPEPDDAAYPLGASTVETAAGVISNPGGAVVGEIGNLVAGLFGGTGKYGTVQSEGAEQARIDAAVLGIEHGSVQAGQFLLGQHQSDTSKYAQAQTTAALNTMQTAYPATMAAAAAAGPQFDTADGVGVMTILVNLGLPFKDQYAGYDTTSTNPGSPAAMALAAKLRALPAPIATIGGTTIPGAINVAGIGSVSTPLLLLGVGLAAYSLYSKSRPGSGRAVGR